MRSNKVLAGLPEDLDAAIFIVLHIPRTGGTGLADIFSRAGHLPAHLAAEGMHIKPGNIYVAVGDHHLILVDGHLGVRRGPRENGNRPAVDALFRSAASYYGRRAIGVVLSGTLDDGTAGARSIRKEGGVIVVQDPADAMYGAMPQSVLDVVGADFTLPAADIGPLLTRLTQEEVEDDPPLPRSLDPREVLLHETDDGALDDDHPGIPSPWPCPDCSGVLWTIEDGKVLRFRCRVGHAWSAESLAHQQGMQIEQALWIALRALEDRAALARTLAERAETAGRPLTARKFREDLYDFDESIQVLRRMIDRHGSEPVKGDSG